METLVLRPTVSADRCLGSRNGNPGGGRRLHQMNCTSPKLMYMRRDILIEPDNKTRGCCCRNSRSTVINPDYNMIKQLCIKGIYDKIRSKSPPNRATSPASIHCDVTYISLTTGVVALHIPLWRFGVREECCRYEWHLKLHGQFTQEWFITIKVIYLESSITRNIYDIVFFGGISHRFEHNHKETYRHWRQDGGWHALSIVTHATHWRRELLLYTSRR